MQVILNEERKANKEHICSFCGGKIEKGEVYQYAKIRGDELYAWKSHKKCEKLLAHLNLDDSGDGITQLDFCDGVSDSIQDLELHEKVDALLFVMKQREAAFEENKSCRNCGAMVQEECRSCENLSCWRPNNEK